MGQTAEATHQITTRVDEEMLRRIDERCEADKRSRSFVLYEAIERLLDAESSREPASTGKAA